MPDQDFNPREAALQYAARVENAVNAATSLDDEDRAAAAAAANAINALACGLVYVGDQLKDLVGLVDIGVSRVGSR